MIKKGGVLDRVFQKDLLKESYAVYPNSLNWKAVLKLYYTFYPDDELGMTEKNLEEFYTKKNRILFSYDTDAGGAIKKDVVDKPPHKLMANMQYLEEHGLIHIKLEYPGQIVPDSIISARGIDFIEDDGGLSAILNTVTVKFDTENIRSLIEAKVLQADIPEEKKTTVVKMMKNASGSVLKKIIDKLIEKAVSDPMIVIKTLGEVLDKAC
ncbi:hypothetical protein GO013_02460 [Pseudodesulfovibrio sp. JC047]|uniref:hypothetical protein n=1 Tax=Pseudodesulfovibrio sp. JC047 TaxID=2683199 RepID=UPI0013CF4A55|nr:hypothetical protein [Pseudodesulfovibrio sp. JC047]NDV18278.1 hypothetical protein [Pseudodesulfovibrio sp. JC047]